MNNPPTRKNAIIIFVVIVIVALLLSYLFGNGTDLNSDFESLNDPSPACKELEPVTNFMEYTIAMDECELSYNYTETFFVDSYLFFDYYEGRECSAPKYTIKDGYLHKSLGGCSNYSGYETVIRLYIIELKEEQIPSESVKIKYN